MIIIGLIADTVTQTEKKTVTECSDLIRRKYSDVTANSYYSSQIWIDGPAVQCRRYRTASI